MVSDIEIKAFIIKSPFGYSNLTQKDRVTVNWLCNNHHGLEWKDGESSLKDVKKYLQQMY